MYFVIMKSSLCKKIRY